MYQICDLHEQCRACLKSFKMSSQNYAEVFKVAMEYENFNGFEVGFAIGEGQPN
jgi:tRNA U54 and U55 pseudouridine synthase Pus10